MKFLPYVILAICGGAYTYIYLFQSKNKKKESNQETIDLEQMEEQTEEQMEEQTEEQTEEQMEEQMEEQIEDQVVEDEQKQETRQFLLDKKVELSEILVKINTLQSSINNLKN